MLISIIPTTNWADVPGCLTNTDVATLACIPVVLQNVINTLIMVAGMVCVFLIVYAGFKFITSEGDPEKVAAARRTVTYAIIGLLFILLSFVVMGLVGSYTGVDQLTPK